MNKYIWNKYCKEYSKYHGINDYNYQDIYMYFNESLEYIYQDDSLKYIRKSNYN